MLIIMTAIYCIAKIKFAARMLYIGELAKIVKKD